MRQVRGRKSRGHVWPHPSGRSSAPGPPSYQVPPPEPRATSTESLAEPVRPPGPRPVTPATTDEDILNTPWTIHTRSRPLNDGPLTKITQQYLFKKVIFHSLMASRIKAKNP